MSIFSRIKKMKDCLTNAEPSPTPASAKIQPPNNPKDVVTDIGVMHYLGSGTGKSDFELEVKNLDGKRLEFSEDDIQAHIDDFGRTGVGRSNFIKPVND